MTPTERVERGIRRLDNGAYQVRVHIARDALTGRVRQVTRTTRGGIREARALRSRLETEVQDGKHGGTAATLGYLLDAWNGHREALGAAPTTLHEDRRKIDKAIRPSLGSVKLAKLDARLLDRFYAERLQRGDSSAQVRHYHSILRAALHQGVMWGWLPANPALRATQPRASTPELPVPTPKQVQLLIDAAAKSRAKELAGIIVVASLTGLRAGELCGLRFSDLQGDHLTVRSSVWARGGKTGIKDPKSHQRRSLVIPALASAVIDLRRRKVAAARSAAGAEMDEDAFVWSRDELGTVPLSPGALSSAFGRIAKKAGVSCRFHDLRHFNASEMVAAGLDHRTVADRLGHADPAFTIRVYTVSRQERDQDAAAHLGSLLTLPAGDEKKGKKR